MLIIFPNECTTALIFVLLYDLPWSVSMFMYVLSCHNHCTKLFAATFPKSSPEYNPLNNLVFFIPEISLNRVQ